MNFMNELRKRNIWTKKTASTSMLCNMMGIQLGSDLNGKGLYVDNHFDAKEKNTKIRITAFTTSEGSTLKLNGNLTDILLISPVDTEAYFQVRIRSGSKIKTHKIGTFKDDLNRQYRLKSMPTTDKPNNVCLIAEDPQGAAMIIRSQCPSIKQHIFFEHSPNIGSAKPSNSPRLVAAPA